MGKISFVQDMKSLWGATKQAYLDSNKPINAIRQGIDSRIGFNSSGMPINNKLFEAVGGKYNTGVRKTSNGGKWQKGDTFNESAEPLTDFQRAKSLFYDQEGNFLQNRAIGVGGAAIAGSYLALR